MGEICTPTSKKHGFGYFNTMCRSIKIEANGEN